jgi:Tol biopolymer transport system component
VSRRAALSGVAAVAVAAGVLTASTAGAYPRPGVTTLVDIGTTGLPATVDNLTVSCTFANCASVAAISGNGRYVAFSSYASNLVAGDRDHGPDVFVRDLQTGKTTMASVSSSGGQQIWTLPNTETIPYLAISGNGRYVAFASNGANLVPGDTNLAYDVFVHDMATATTTRVDVSASGGQLAQGVADGLSMSADGRYVAYTSAAADVVTGDTNGVNDVFVRDLKTARTQRASVSSAGAQGDGASDSGTSLSPTGRYVVFGSDATTLVAGDTNQQRDVFLRDLQKHTTELISVRPDGSEVLPLGGNSSASYGPGSAVSSDGRYVLFNSNANSLVPNDDNGNSSDWFLRDRATHRTERINVASDGTDRQTSSAGEASITPDGRFVVFRSQEDLVADDRGTCADGGVGPPSPDTDVYVHDRRTGATDLISRSTSGAHAYSGPTDTIQGCQSSVPGSISDDGRRVAFVSSATNLVKGDTNKHDDVFLRDRGADAGVDGFGEQQPAPAPQPCAAGTCPPPLCVAGICPPVGADVHIVAGVVVQRASEHDLYVDEELQGLGAAPVLYGVDIKTSAGLFQLRAQQIGAGSPVASIELFRAAASGWMSLGRIPGGFGTAGRSVVAAIPATMLGLDRGGRLESATVFTAIGAVATGAVQIRERMVLQGASHV